MYLKYTKVLGYSYWDIGEFHRIHGIGIVTCTLSILGHGYGIPVPYILYGIFIPGTLYMKAHLKNQPGPCKYIKKSHVDPMGKIDSHFLLKYFIHRSFVFVFPRGGAVLFFLDTHGSWKKEGFLPLNYLDIQHKSRWVVYPP